jgi:hypothetical protein
MVSWNFIEPFSLFFFYTRKCRLNKYFRKGGINPEERKDKTSDSCEGREKDKSPFHFALPSVKSPRRFSDPQESSLLICQPGSLSVEVQEGQKAVHCLYLSSDLDDSWVKC